MTGDEDKGDIDIGDEDYQYNGGRIRGLSNQIEHVKKLRKFSPFKDVKVPQKSAPDAGKRPQPLTIPAIPVDSQGEDAPSRAAQVQKPERRSSFALDAQQQPHFHEEKKVNLDKINDLLKQVKSLTVSDDDASASKI